MPFPAKTGLRANKVSKKKPAHPKRMRWVQTLKYWGYQPAEVAVAAPAAEQ
jgi:hypothetical protein